MFILWLAGLGGRPPLPTPILVGVVAVSPLTPSHTLFPYFMSKFSFGTGTEGIFFEQVSWWVGGHPPHHPHQETDIFLLNTKNTIPQKKKTIPCIKQAGWQEIFTDTGNNEKVNRTELGNGV